MMTVSLAAAARNRTAPPEVGLGRRLLDFQRSLGIFVRRARPALPNTGGRLGRGGHRFLLSILLVTLVGCVLPNIGVPTGLVGAFLGPLLRLVDRLGGVAAGALVAAVFRGYG